MLCRGGFHSYILRHENALLTSRRHITRQVHAPKAVSQRKLDFEHKRPRLLRECMAEATGVYFYVLPGIAAVTAFTLSTTNGLGEALGTSTFGGLFQIGVAFGFGIAFAIITCASTSGGHVRLHLFRRLMISTDVLLVQPSYHNLSLALARLPNLESTVSFRKSINAFLVSMKANHTLC